MYESLFYDRLIQLRMEKGISARDMSLSIGQSAGYINSLENRNAFPSMQVFFYICEFLDVTPSEFFDAGNRHPSDMAEIIHDLNELSKQELDGIKVIIKAMTHK